MLVYVLFIVRKESKTENLPPEAVAVIEEAACLAGVNKEAYFASELEKCGIEPGNIAGRAIVPIRLDTQTIKDLCLQKSKAVDGEIVKV